MMKLILSLTLIWTLSSIAEALQCWQGVMGMQVLHPCASTEWCTTVASQQGTENGNQLTIRSCEPLPPTIEGKHTVSFNVGFLSASVHVCNTDGCNSEDIPYPDDLKKNNLTCFTCDDPFSAECKKKTVQCDGVQDRCISGTVESIVGAKGHAFGCVSGNFCEHLSDLKNLPGAKFIQPPKCCEGSFCNSAWSVKLNVMTLLFGLITLIFY